MKKKIIKISVVGVGLMGMQHIKAINRSQKVKLHSIVDVNKKVMLTARKYSVPFFKDIKKLMINKPDAVIISTPNKLHEKYAINFLRNKIPVLLEKPISDKISTAKKIVISSKENKTPLLIGYHRRHNIIIDKVKNIIDSGKLGKIVSANVMCWFYKHSEYFKEKWRVTEGGGPLSINLVHDLDVLSYLLGKIKYVQAIKSNKIRNYKVEDTAIVNLIFSSGVLCTLNISDAIVSPWSYELTAGENPVYPLTDQSAYFIGGTKSSIQFPNLKNWYYDGKKSWWNKIKVLNFKNKKIGDTLVNQINHFSEVVSKKIKPKVNGEDGLNSLKVYDAIIKSSKLGKKIRI